MQSLVTVTGADGTESFRTPETRFERLPGYPWRSHHCATESVRVAYVDEGEGEPVVLLHGVPTWAYVWRSVLDVLIGAGYRCIAPDLPGFGRSDKPVHASWHTYDRHTRAFAQVLESVGVRDATLVVHDSGGPIGLRVAVEHPHLVSRMVLVDSGVFTGQEPMSPVWDAFRSFVEEAPDLPVGLLVAQGCRTELAPEVIAAYEAPFPSAGSKAGPRTLPLLLPTSPEAPGASEGRRTLAALRSDARPKLMLWAEHDPVLPLKAGERLASTLGMAPPLVIAGAGHFPQEDAPGELAAQILSWLQSG